MALSQYTGDGGLRVQKFVQVSSCGVKPIKLQKSSEAFKNTVTGIYPYVRMRA